MPKFRTAKDSMGEMQIPADRLYGASTQRAVLNFPISGYRFTRPFIHALGQIKLSAARANAKLKLVSRDQSAAIQAAAKEVRDGKWDSEFVLDVFQTGSGTSTNMNANEVISTLANRRLSAKRKIHPNDHVNKGQSSNDVIPTAIHVAVVVESAALIATLRKLEVSLRKKAAQFKKIYKIGRTHLQDATPITLGQEFGGYAEQVRKAVLRVEEGLKGMRELALGGTAVGTGMNAHPRFAKLAIQDMNSDLGESFFEARDHFEGQSTKDACVDFSGRLRTVAVSLTKVANDVRWLGSGPRGGIREIKVPAVQPGSSIMPGKVNPVIAEALLQVCAQVMGNDLTVTLAAQSSAFELNVMMPVIAHNLLESVKLMTSACEVFRTKSVDGIEADLDGCKDKIESSLMLCTALVPVLGYDKSAQLAKEAYKTGKTIRQIVRDYNLVPDKELNRLLDVTRLTSSE